MAFGEVEAKMEGDVHGGFVSLAENLNDLR